MPVIILRRSISHFPQHRDRIIGISSVRKGHGRFCQVRGHDGQIGIQHFIPIDEAAVVHNDFPESGVRRVRQRNPGSEGPKQRHSQQQNNSNPFFHFPESFPLDGGGTSRPVFSILPKTDPKWNGGDGPLKRKGRSPFRSTLDFGTLGTVPNVPCPQCTIYGML